MVYQKQLRHQSLFTIKTNAKSAETMDELFNFSKEFTKDGKYGFLALGDNFYFANAFMAGMGGYVFGEKMENQMQVMLD